MRTRARAAAALLATCLACDGGGWLGGGAARFREVSAREGRALVGQAGARLVQVGRAPLSLALREGAQLVDADWEWPSDLPHAGPVVIVAAQPEAGLRVAARLARAGIQDVAIVSGGIDAWNQERTLAAAPGKNGSTTRE